MTQNVCVFLFKITDNVFGMQLSAKPHVELLLYIKGAFVWGSRGHAILNLIVDGAYIRMYS